MTGLRVAAWWGVALAIGWVCIASVLDRLAQAGVFVAAPPALSWGGASRHARAEAAWATGDLRTGSALSRAALARRPVDAATLRSAGAIALAEGDLSRGVALMRLAGAAGWRDRPTQLYWAQAALDQRDVDVAAQRIEAVARAGDFADARALFRRVEATPAGRAALLVRLRAPSPWRRAALGDWRQMDAAAIAHRLVMVVAARPYLTRGDLNAIVAPLLVANRYDDAFALLRPDERTLRFVAGGEPGPLDWHLTIAAGIDAVVVTPDTLRVAASGPALMPFADRLVRLPLGTTRLTARIDGARTDLPLIATLQCLNGTGATAAITAAPRGRIAFDLIVPPGCTTQRLGLAVTGAEALAGAAFTLHAPTVTRATAVP